MNKENTPSSRILFVLPFLMLMLSISACSNWLTIDNEYDCERFRGTWRNSTCYGANEGDGKFDQDGDEADDVSAEEGRSIPVGTYSGKTNFVKTLNTDKDDSFLEPVCTKSTVQLVVGGDGAAHGEISSICYASLDTDNEEMRTTHHSDVTGVIEGELLENSGQLSIAYTWHSYLTSPQWEAPSLDNTVEFVFPYHVQLVENVMTFTPAAEVEDYYTFTLHNE